MEDFASSIGLTVSQRERLLQQLGVEDQELLDAKQLAPWAGETPTTGPEKNGWFDPGKWMKHDGENAGFTGEKRWKNETTFGEHGG